MHHADYERVIRELCAVTGIDDWRHVVHTQHVEVVGTLVGLIHQEEQTRDTLCLAFDLSVVGDPVLCRKLLEMNIRIGTGELAYFALHPERGTVVYRSALRLTPALTGEMLFAQILHCLQEGQLRLEAVR